MTEIILSTEKELIMRENKIEMCVLDRRLPRYYKGYDMNILIQKMVDEKPLTPEEENIIDEAQDIYYKNPLKKVRNNGINIRKPTPGYI